MIRYKKEYYKHLASRGLAKSTIQGAVCGLRLFETYLYQNYEDVPPENKWDKTLLEQFYRYVCAYTYTKADTGSSGFAEEIGTKKYVRKKLCAAVRYAYFLCIKKYLVFCQEENIIYDNPFDRIRIKLAARDKLIEDISEEVIAEMVSAIPVYTWLGYRDRAIIELLYGSGLRLSEAYNLNIEDIDFREGIVRIKRGKGRKDRNVPLGEVSAAYLKEYITTVRTYLLVEENQHENAVFVSRRGKRLSKVIIGKMISDYSKKAGTRNITPHKLRHAFALHMMRRGCDIRFIQEILGHEELSTTQVYTEVFDKELKEKIEQYHPLAHGTW